MTEKTKSKDILTFLTSKEFVDFCNKKLVPALTPFEEKRTEMLKKTNRFFSCGIICIGLCFAVYNFSQANNHDNSFVLLNIIAVALAIAGIAFLGISTAIKNSFISEIKSSVYQILFSYWGHFKYRNLCLLTQEEFDVLDIRKQKKDSIKSLKLFDSFNDFSCEDNILGVYNGLNLEITELNLTKETGSGKTRRTETIFKGILIESDCNKSFNSTTVVRRDFGKGCNAFQNLSGLQKVNLEDPVFEAQFEVYSNDQIEARYLLTTAFMERLLKAQKRSGMTVTCSFENGKLYIAAHSPKNWFEIPVEKSLIDIKNFQSIFLELYTLLFIIDGLRVDDKIGM